MWRRELGVIVGGVEALSGPSRASKMKAPSRRSLPESFPPALPSPPCSGLPTPPAPPLPNCLGLPLPPAMPAPPPTQLTIFKGKRP